MARSRSSDSQSPPPKSDAYVGLLAISLVAQITGAVFFYLDWSSYPTSTPTPPAPISAGPLLPQGGGAPPPGGPPAGMPAVGGMPPAAGGMPPMAGGMPPMAGGMPPAAGGMPPMAGGMGK